MTDDKPLGLLECGDLLDVLGRVAPSAPDLFDRALDDLFLLDVEHSAQREVIKGPRSPALDDVEAREVPAEGAAITDRLLVYQRLGLLSSWMSGSPAAALTLL